jgi:hypothetical protein
MGRYHRRRVAAVGSERRLRGMAIANNADGDDFRRDHGDALAGRAEGGWPRLVGQGWEGERQKGEPPSGFEGSHAVGSLTKSEGMRVRQLGVRPSVRPDG